jgi:DNA-binding SARP family transcriptional activator
VGDGASSDSPVRYRLRSDSAGLSDSGISDLLFQQFPYGIVLLHRNGTVSELNPAARTLLGLVQGNGGPDAFTCCELFGCRVPGGPLEHGCLTKMALEATGPVAEIRIDLPPGSGTTAVWLTPARLRSDPPRVLVHLRPGDRRDRRRRNVPLWPSVTELEIFTLGRTMVRTPEGSLGGAWLHQRAGVLLKYLVCERDRVVSPDEIAEALWPQGDQRSVANVRHFVHALRSHLEPGRGKRAPSRFVVAEPGGYRLGTEAVRVDADEFAHAVSAGLRRWRHNDFEVAERLLVEGVRLYGGDFLADERYALWAFSERDRLRDLAADALGVLAQLRRQAGDFEGETARLERLAELCPLDPEVQRGLIAVALERGRHTVAKRRYAALRQRMLMEFGREPSFNLADVAADVAEGTKLSTVRGL